MNGSLANLRVDVSYPGQERRSVHVRTGARRKGMDRYSGQHVCDGLTGGERQGPLGELDRPSRTEPSFRSWLWIEPIHRRSLPILPPCVPPLSPKRCLVPPLTAFLTRRRSPTGTRGNASPAEPTPRLGRRSAAPSCRSIRSRMYVSTTRMARKRTGKITMRLCTGQMKVNVEYIAGLLVLPFPSLLF